jgi:hypothetical protein
MWRVLGVLSAEAVELGHSESINSSMASNIICTGKDKEK